MALEKDYESREQVEEMLSRFVYFVKKRNNEKFSDTWA